MEKCVLITYFLMYFVLACTQNDHRVCANPEEAQRMFDHLTQESHWDGMWFSGLKDNTMGAGSVTVALLQMMSPLMGCSYGVTLNWFLLTALEAIGECDTMMIQPRRIDDQLFGLNADDCKRTLSEVIETGKTLIWKLMGALQCIDSAIDKPIEDNRFYQTLKPLRPFLDGQINVEFSGEKPGGLDVNLLFIRVSESLGFYLTNTCEPPYQDFTAHKARRNSALYPNGMYYAVCVNVLKKYIQFVDNHLLQLGFHYDKNDGTVNFNPGQSSHQQSLRGHISQPIS